MGYNGRGSPCGVVAASHDQHIMLRLRLYPDVVVWRLCRHRDAIINECTD